MDLDVFTEAYRGAPPWEIAAPQPAVAALAAQGGFRGRVLDVGCGTGENALHLAAQGLWVLGVDGTPAAVERARAKAEQRGLPVRFAPADAFDLVALGGTFDSVLDSAFLHIHDDRSVRLAYTDQLARVVRPGARVHLLEISDLAVGDFPTIAAAEIVGSFDDRWTHVATAEAGYAVVGGDVPASLVTMERRSTRVGTG